jgi:UDP-N-acetylglucosamine--N-acetylmuramyl-(pentapeptide) pyrophosphoryl-undecaprenol N-acetylglucosamine transferase
VIESACVNALVRRHVVIAGGGTGGHLYPGIAVAREISRRWPDASVTFAGTSRGLEARVVPREGFELDVIRSAGLKGKSIGATMRGGLLILPGLIDAWRIVSRRQPAVVVGVGGYSSGPVVLAAALRRVPTMVLEQNVVPGVTNRWLAPWVRAAAVTYSETLPFFKGKGFVSGNPVRPEFFREPGSVGQARESRAAFVRVLVLGGSQGAHAINVAMVAAATELARRIPDLDIVHQAGERDVAAVREGYLGSGLRARVEAFLDPVVDEMKAADLAVCRAGATTLAELAAVGLPAVLVPFPSATDDHQRKNARVLAEAGAAEFVDERGMTGAALAHAIADLIGDRARLGAMRRTMREFAQPEAAAQIVDRLAALAGWSGPAASQ